MPDKSAQHEARTWFEEPLRTDGAASNGADSVGDDRFDQSAADTLSGSRVERDVTARAPADVPDADVPEVEVPNAEVRNAEVPEVEVRDVDGREADAPHVEQPDVELRHVELPDVGLPNFGSPAEASGMQAAAGSPERPAAHERPAVQVPSGSEDTVPAQPTVSADAPTRPAATVLRGTIDDAETTVVIPVVSGRSAHRHRPSHAAQYPETPGDDSATAEIPRIRSAAADLELPGLPSPDSRHAADLPGPPHDGGSGTFGGEPARLRRLGGIAAAVVLGLLAIVYGADVAASRAEVPRGVVVAGVDVGGLQPAAAEQRLREQIEPRLTRPIPVRAGDVDATLVPEQAGLKLDWPGTLAQAGEQPLNPWTRFSSLFTTREVGVVTNGDRTALSAALEGLRPEIDRAPAEGTIRFEGAQPIPVDPVAGQRLDLPGATDTLLAEWARGAVVQVPVETLPVSTTPDGIRATLRNFVEPAVASPITVTGEGAQAVLEPEVTASALRFAPDGEGGLAATVDNPTVIAALAPQLAATERIGKDAGVILEGGHPVVQPSAEGRAIDWVQSLQPLPDVLRAVAVSRKMPAVYVTKSPKLTTEQANGLGVTAQISTFTTHGFAEDSGKNIRRAAEQVNGALVLPGETFSLNGHTGPRNAASGYHEAGIIEDGHPARGIGGGVSQFATTLFNASYFAGMVDVEHKEHSYYISRYPAAREATVYEGAIDVKFRNDSPTAVLIQTAWSPTSVTVTFWGTKHVNVESIPGPRTDPTDPDTVRLSHPHCVDGNGSKGFTTTDTRVIRDAATGAEIDR
ncbi:MAG: VanW family protein, partial [Pseudonocardiaceae bacterium]